MALAALFSLALLGASPATVQLAQAEPAPAEAPVMTGKTADDEARAAASAAGDPIPAGAPVDDYRFVAWCSGALSEHMALRSKVWDEVQRIERAFPTKDTPADQAIASYDEDEKADQERLKLFSHALDLQDARHVAASKDREAAIQQGQGTWKGADTAQPAQLAQAWMSWDLPPRCDRVATKLAGKKKG